MNSAHFDFTGMHVLVTGGSNGIGLGIATAFGAAGATVTVTGTRPATGYAHDLSRFDYRQLDMRDTAAISQLCARLQRLDVLINNAGANFARQPSEWDPAVFEDSVRINLFGAFRMAVACKPLLAESRAEGGASVINLASMSSFFAVPVVPGYGAAKAAIVQMTKNLAVTWASEKIRVNAVAPGLIRSNMTAGMQGIEAVEKPLLDRTAMHRWGTPDDIAPACLFLASDAARFITGQTLCVDGGYSAS
ncbi:MAG TPA: SDR family oxidoreductase [Candidatus Acidoferrales bacterium]|nr:SDR family oxidoreductase [Candidatus Acidoferrales bacterium]